MLDTTARTDELEQRDVEIEQAASKAAVAGALLAQPDLGITRITYVGLSDRQAVRLALAVRQRGLRPTLGHGPNSLASVEVHRSPDRERTLSES